MRLIGHLKNEGSARTFAGYLLSLDIRNQVEPDSDGWGVWIHSEDQIEAGHQALAAFLQNPGDLRYRRAAEAAAGLEQRRRREEAAAADRIRTRAQIWNRSGSMPLTLSLIVVCVLVTVFSGLTPTLQAVHWLLISEWNRGWLPEVRSGQIWRLFTPIFIHFGPMHLIFNMLVLRDLGGMVEFCQGTRKLALMVLVLALGSNLGQYLLFNPYFGGMSGVLYGIFGYIWVRSQSDPASGLALSPMTVAMMLVWFFLCLFGLLGGTVANGAHGVGLIMGIIWGALPLAKRIGR
ncbi:MAG: rhomboid family intramembrane serine protease [Verrucomicrobiota bacterium]